uniref:IRG-type G domain-containing protein n=1 Tax=Panagrolaimus davidi TaxID=227884 RepID=A0A914QJ02_9BILA
MGQSLGQLATHPLTGLALQIGYNWLTSLPSEEQCDGERAYLNNLAMAGFNSTQMTAIMPNQKEYIQRMNEMEDQIAAEQMLTKKYQESLKKTKRKLEEQIKKNAEMEQYLTTKPAKNVKIRNDIKISAVEAANRNGVDNKNYVNFAFVGHTKNGKSSIINAIRGLGKNDDGAAAVDVLECTQDIQYYTVPDGRMPNVRFYDVPGSGAMAHHAESYYRDKALCGFDCLIILIQQTLCEEEINFALAALEYNQKVVFLRSKCDIDFHLKNESGTTLKLVPTPEEIQEHISDLRHGFEKELERFAPELSAIRCFFVSAKSMRAIIRGEKTDMVFEEAEFLEYLYQQSKKARGITTF